MQPLSLQSFCPELSDEKIFRIAKTRFVKRVEKKITANQYLFYFYQESIKGTVSYNDLTVELSCVQIRSK